MTTLLKYYLDYPSVTIDSRNIRSGQIFFAIKGEHFDGNNFVLQALEAGAALCVASDTALKGHENVLIVEDTLVALQNLAREYRETFKFPVLAITGSNGKTTSKELLATVLNTKYKVHYTAGNLNNHLGVPLTLLATPPDADFAVIEMGANHQGEISSLCSIAMPKFGAITNIGAAHLEGFGGMEGVKKGKSELFKYLMANDGLFFLNIEEKSLDFLKAHDDRIMNIGFDSEEIARSERESEFLSFEFQGNSVETHLVGQYNLSNVLLAFGVGRYFGCDPNKMCEAIAEYIPKNNRSQMTKFHGVHVIMDAYNANPSSVLSAIDNLNKMPETKKGVFLGDMLELGEDSASFHKKILDRIHEIGTFSFVSLIGPQYRQFETAYPEFQFFDSTSDVLEEIDWQQLKDFTILIKGSRGMQLEKLLT